MPTLLVIWISIFGVFSVLVLLFTIFTWVRHILIMRSGGYGAGTAIGVPLPPSNHHHFGQGKVHGHNGGIAGDAGLAGEAVGVTVVDGVWGGVDGGSAMVGGGYDCSGGGFGGGFSDLGGGGGGGGGGGCTDSGCGGGGVYDINIVHVYHVTSLMFKYI